MGEALVPLPAADGGQAEKSKLLDDMDSRIEAAHRSATAQLVQDLEGKRKSLQDKLKELDRLRGRLRDFKATIASTKALLSGGRQIKSTDAETSDVEPEDEEAQ